MDYFNQRYQKDPSVVSQEIAGEVILVPVRQSVSEVNSIFTLNETAAYAWSLIDGQRTMGEIHQQILDEYNVDDDQARQDLFELIDRLQQIGAIVVV
jgi:Coenzyme PQQ synthesis protein D (PqqD)